MALGFQVLAAARAVEAGGSFTQVLDLARRSANHTGVVFAVETLEFLHRGGRIGGAARLLGTALNLKPVLELVDGRIEAVERVRTKAKARARLLEIVQERVKGKANVRLATVHAAAEAEAIELLEQAKAVVNPVETVVAMASPVVGNHTGPGTVGLAYSTDL
jgi:DegV family protein with EDD domain